MTTLEKISGAATGSNVIIMNKQSSLSQYIYTHTKEGSQLQNKQQQSCKLTLIADKKKPKASTTN